MRKLVLALAVVLAGALPISAAMTVDELIQKNVEAHGGASALEAVKSLRLTGKITFGGGDGTVEAAFAEIVARPDKSRSELTLQGLTAVDAYDGAEGWSVEPFGGRLDARKASADENREFVRRAELDGPLRRWKEKGHTVESLGSEDVDGTLAYKLRVNRKDGDTQIYFLDPDSFLEMRVQTTSHVRGTENESETDFGDYRKVSGVWIPFAIDSGVKGGPKGSHLLLERVEMNVAMDDALFKMPAQGARASRSLFASTTAAATQAGAVSAPRPSGAPVMDERVLSGLGVRCIGSAAMSGRIAAVAARNEGGKTTVFVGSASGGVWKSLDGGTTFKPVFDKQPVQSIGAVTIDPSDPKIVWAGTGEGWTRNSSSIGDGIYKSTDAGETWKNMGLPESERIVRILVHPKNSNVVYAAVPGKEWSDSPDRGLYKTSDGGATWELILKGGNVSTGCSSVAMDPTNPDVLLAGMWDFRRKGWTFRSGGERPEAGSGSGLFRSQDGGKSWTRLDATTAPGLPAFPWGRVEVVVAPSDSQRVYALIESRKSGLFVSSDGGRTFEARDRSQMMVWRPFYFARLVVDPTDPNRLFKPDGGLIASEDGGKSFSYSGGGSHGDWHDLWIDPDNPKRVIGGDDGGLWTSIDGGNRWWKNDSLPVSQFYHVSLDDADPYHVYGGLQDNSSWIGDSAYPGGITNARWENLYGGDGFWTLVDPSDPNYVYAESQGGFIGRVNRFTHEGRDIQPKAGLHEKLRYNWNAPIHVSPTQKNVVYLGAQFLFRSKDHGDNWERISPDLTTNDPEKQKQELSGGVTVDNSSAEMHTTIYSIAESPRNPMVIWAGTDDGNLQLTRDGGKTWTNVVANVPGLPAFSWVSWVEASRFDAATAYACFDRHTFGDMAPHVFKTTDYGKTWTSLVSAASGVRGYAHCVKEDTVNRSLMFLGTEFGLWISLDEGKTWAAFKARDFPAVAVREIQVHSREGDLVLATHGRGIWIVDDLTPLRALTPELAAKSTAFLPDRPVQQRMQAGGGWVEGDAKFVGDNPSGGATITYYLRTRQMYGSIKLEVLDGAGKVVDTVPATKRRGINRVAWSMRVKPPRVPKAAQVAGSSLQGPRVVPGVYTVRLTSGPDVVEKKITVGLDRRAPYNESDRRAQFEAAMRASGVFGTMSDLVGKIDAAKTSADAAAGQLKEGDATLPRLSALGAKLDAVKKKIVATKEGGDITGEERLREHLDYLYGALNGWEGKPGAYQLERLSVLTQELAEVSKEFDTLAAKEIAPLNDELKAKGMGPIAFAVPSEDEPSSGALSSAGAVWRSLRFR